MRRRQFLRNLGVLGVCGWGAGLGAVRAQQLQPNQLPPRGFLDELREKIHDWTESLWDDKQGGFRQNADIGVNLLSADDVAWLRYAVNDPDIGGKRRAPWEQYLLAAQNPQTGVITYTPGPAAQNHKTGHAFWSTVRALNILGKELPHFPHHLRKVATLDGLRAWFDAVDWEAGVSSDHHEVLGLVPLLASTNNQAWIDLFFDKLTEQQSSETGAWPRSHTGISRTFAYTAIYRAAGRMPRYPEKIVDTMLSLQKPDGSWDLPSRKCATMDAAYLVSRLTGALGYRRPDAMAAMERLKKGHKEFFQKNYDSIAQNPHWMLPVVHAFGLLQEVFPDDFPSERPYRFDWDKLAMYRCNVIVQGLA